MCYNGISRYRPPTKRFRLRSISNRIISDTTLTGMFLKLKGGNEMILFGISSMALIGAAYFFIDLRIDHWEWENWQRRLFYCLCMTSAVFCASVTVWHPIIIRAAVGIVAMFVLCISLLDQRKRNRRRAVLSIIQARRFSQSCVIHTLIMIFMFIKIMAII